VNTLFHAASQEMYNAQNAQQGGANPGDPFGGQDPNAGNAGGGQNDGVEDADFEEVK
jgi:molecular chaperone DnaK